MVVPVGIFLSLCAATYLGCVLWDVLSLRRMLLGIGRGEASAAVTNAKFLTSIAKLLLGHLEAIRFRLNSLEWQIDLAQQIQSKTPTEGLPSELGRDVLADERNAMAQVMRELQPKLRAHTGAIILNSDDGEPMATYHGTKGERFERELSEYFDHYLQSGGSLGPTGRIELVTEGAQQLVFFGFRYAICFPVACVTNGKTRRGLIWFGYQQPVVPSDLEVHVVRAGADEVARQVQAAAVVQNLSGKVAEAESDAREKSEFLAHMSHDIRTPLNNIKNIFALLREEKNEDERSELLEMGMTNAQNMTELLTSILDFARHRVGKLTADIQTVDLAATVKELVGSFQPTARAKALNLTISLPSERECLVRADPRHLKRVLTNLISNALKFTDEGGVNVVVSRAAAGSGSYCISVIDTGRGMCRENLDALFTPFTRFDRSVDGIGLGLALSKVLVDLNGGSLRVESEQGKGTRFALEVPGHNTSSLDLSEPSPAAHLEGVTILLADDDRDVVGTTARILERAGYKTLRAYSVADVVALLNFDTPNLILCDKNLGDGTAVEVLKFIERRERAMPLILLSGSGVADEQELVDVRTLEKPIEPERLLAEVAQALSVRSKAVGEK